MKILRKFEENLEYLGFDLAPIAWDLAKMKFENEDDRLSLLEELTVKREAAPDVEPGLVG